MIRRPNPTSNEIEERSKVSTYLRSFVKKIISSRAFKILAFILILGFLNLGSKFPVKSEQLDNSSKQAIDYFESRNEAEKYMKMYQEILERSTIQQIEFESEIVIPEYFDFKYVEYVSKIADDLEVPRRLAFRLIFKESSFDDDVISKAGAKGLMQLMPSTRSAYYKDLCVDTLHLDKNQEDIYIGLSYLKDLREFWKKRGNPDRILWKLSIASYNAGSSKVIQYRGVPPYKETIDFVNFIVATHSNPAFYANILAKNSKSIKNNS